ncbi:coil containing protein [Vibrio phage 1.168.O._10N.261.52.A10]|nr:coil containing protein [Vibrio phage 1.168.O._10N.261.52.A10]
MAQLKVEVKETGLKQTTKDLDNLTKSGNKADKSASDLKATFAGMAKGAAGATAAIYAGVAAFNKLEDALVDTVAAASDFSRSMDEDVRANFLALGEEFNALNARQDKALADMLSGTTQFVYDSKVQWTEFKETLAGVLGGDDAPVLITKEIKQQFEKDHKDLYDIMVKWNNAGRYERLAWKEDERKEAEYANALLYGIAKGQQDKIYALHDGNRRDQIELETLMFKRQLLGQEEYQRQRLEIQMRMINRDIALAESEDEANALKVKYDILLQLQKELETKSQESADKAATEKAQKEDQANADTMAALKKMHEDKQAEIDKANKKELKEKEKTEKEKSRIEEKEAAAARERKKDALDAWDTMTQDLKDVLGEQNAIYKASAITNATIKAYEAANSAYAALAPIPYVGPYLGAAAAGVAVSAGLANVAAIQSARMQGGQVNANQAYTVGERGPETFVPNSAGSIVPANQAGQSMGTTVNVYNQAQGVSVQAEQNADGGTDIYVTREEFSGLMAAYGSDPDSDFNRTQDSLYSRPRS